MKLIPKYIEEQFAAIGDQSQSTDPIVVAKFFNPIGGQTWYATEYDKENNSCFGYVTGFDYDEWGSFSIDELEAITLRYGLKIERDIFFENIRFKEIIKDKEQQKNKNQDLEQ